MGTKEYFAKRKLKKQFVKEGLISPGPSLGYRYRESRLGKAQHAMYGFLDNPEGTGRKTNGGKGRKKNPFGKIKDRSLTQGFF